jgi:hypothetical protein
MISDGQLAHALAVNRGPRTVKPSCVTRKGTEGFKRFEGFEWFEEFERFEEFEGFERFEEFESCSLDSPRW